MSKAELLAKLGSPVAYLTLAVVRLLPHRAQAAFFNLIRGLFNPDLLEKLFDDACVRHLKGRVIKVPVKQIRIPWTVEIPLELDMGDYIQRRFFFHGYPDFMPDLLRFCDEATLFFDVGANVGLVALGVATKVPAGNIHAFEPIPATFKQLRQNTASNQPHLECHQIAISDRRGELRMAVIDTDSGSATADGPYLQSRLESNRVTAEMDYVTCPTQTFDEFWSSLALAVRSAARKVAIKIDVEGHELAVLAGMTAFLNEVRQELFVVCETHLQNLGSVRQAFEPRGFQLIAPGRDLLGDPRRFGTVQDLVFHRRSGLPGPPLAG